MTSEIDPSVFDHNVVVRVLHELMNLSISSAICSFKSNRVKEKFLNFVKLNAIVASEDTCLWAGGFKTFASFSQILFIE